MVTRKKPRFQQGPTSSKDAGCYYSETRFPERGVEAGKPVPRLLGWSGPEEMAWLGGGSQVGDNGWVEGIFIATLEKSPKGGDDDKRVHSPIVYQTPPLLLSG